MIGPITWLLPTLGALFALPHPHHPKVLPIGCANGTVTLRTMTVPYNAKHLKALKAGFTWHLGFSMLETEVPLAGKAADGESIAVPAGKYTFGAKLNEAGKWDLSLQHREFAMMRMRVRRMTRRSPDNPELEKMRAELESMASQGHGKAIVIPMTDVVAEHAEHLEMEVLHRGFATKDRREWKPIVGAKFEIRVHFGDMHRSVALSESLAANGQSKEAEPKKASGGRDR